ncbi:unnamed protein product [Caenorhabditis angaria]|uniref:Uncharacterized protein n=1 Tax=Caenorhabditis angaria TaxID=860376 RepID=A0A9P1MSZ5_9PELO|nr:unnamed protein product [Caenorhabditis angaria]
MAQDQPRNPEGQVVVVEANDVQAELRSRLRQLGFFNLAEQLGLNISTEETEPGELTTTGSETQQEESPNPSPNLNFILARATL